MNIVAPYEGEDWARGPALVYDRLAETLVDASPEALAGRGVLDLGAGTGAATKALRRQGARPFAADLSPAMLGYEREARPPAVVADAAVLPFPAAAFDAVVAAFVINHVSEPAGILREASRVTVPGGPVLASVFSAHNSHPSKEQVQEVATAFGFHPPDWYERLKCDVEPLTATPEALRATADRAGLTHVDVQEREVDVGVRAPGQLVAWRLGMAYLAPFVAALDIDRRRRLVEEAEAAVGPDPEPYCPTVLILAGRAPVSRRRGLD